MVLLGVRKISSHAHKSGSWYVFGDLTVPKFRRAPLSFHMEVLPKEGSRTISVNLSFRSIIEPWISCPSNINVDLKPGMNTSAVGDKWTLPTSNVKKITAVDPPGVSGSYQFSAGTTNVKWAAVNEIGKSAYCVIQVNIKGKYALLVALLLIFSLLPLYAVVIKCMKIVNKIIEIYYHFIANLSLW